MSQTPPDTITSPNYSLSDDQIAALQCEPLNIISFTATADDGSEQQPDSLQIAQGTSVTLQWQITGDPDELEVIGASSSVSTSATSLSDTPDADTVYTLRAKNAGGQETATLLVAVHPAEAPVSAHAIVDAGDAAPAPQPANTGSITFVQGEDTILIDPPVRLWPQWAGSKGDADLQGQRQLAGKDGMPVTWQDSGCGPSSAAMILRWFAEDCKAGRITFPSKDGSTLPANLYGPRMAQAFWPDGFHYYKGDRPGNPIGKVELDNSGVDNHQLQDHAAKLLGADKSFQVANRPADGWLPLIKQMLTVGPVILGIGPPSPHGHFVICHGIRPGPAPGAMLIVDPGNIINNDWAGKNGMRNGQYMPPKEQWPSGLPNGGCEDDKRGYVEVSGGLMQTLLNGLKHISSLTWPNPPVLGPMP